MLPSEDNIANFIAFAPDADEGKAFAFLEVNYPVTLIRSEYRFIDMFFKECGYNRGGCQPVL